MRAQTTAEQGGEASVAAFDAAWDEFFGALRRARGRAVGRQRGGLSLSQYHLLRPLEDRADLPVGELALAAGVSSPTATRMLDVLERSGLVVRRRSEADRRMVGVRLTSSGRRLLARKRLQVAERRLELFNSLAPGERRHAGRLLMRLAGLIEEL
jgi:MarR family transcriptional regulator, organic hydroperoxide resistance regulator